MGRKRKAWGDERKPITVSLPRQLIIDLDKTLSEEQTRSRLFERLVRNYLRVNTDLRDFQRHLYHCLDCHLEWHLNKRIDASLMVCRGSNGCGSVNIAYIGIYKEDEE